MAWKNTVIICYLYWDTPSNLILQPLTKNSYLFNLKHMYHLHLFTYNVCIRTKTKQNQPNAEATKTNLNKPTIIQYVRGHYYVCNNILLRPTWPTPTQVRAAHLKALNPFKGYLNVSLNTLTIKTILSSTEIKHVGDLSSIRMLSMISNLIIYVLRCRLNMHAVTCVSIKKPKKAIFVLLTCALRGI